MKMLGGYMELFMKPELATMYLSIKRELDELVQKKVYIWSQVFTVNQTFMLIESFARCFSASTLFCLASCVRCADLIIYAVLFSFFN